MSETKLPRLPPDYQPCPLHAGMLLRIAVREAERMLCPICAQERRARGYAASKAAWLRSAPSIPDGAPEAAQRQAVSIPSAPGLFPGIACEGGYGTTFPRIAVKSSIQ